MSRVTRRVVAALALRNATAAATWLVSGYGHRPPFSIDVVVSPEQPRFFSCVPGWVLRSPSRTGPAYPRSFWSPDGWLPAARESPSARYQPSGAARRDVVEVVLGAGRGRAVGEGGGVVIVARMPSGPAGCCGTPEQPVSPSATTATAADAAAASRRLTGTACHADAPAAASRPAGPRARHENRSQTSDTRSKHRLRSRRAVRSRDRGTVAGLSRRAILSQAAALAALTAWRRIPRRPARGPLVPTADAVSTLVGTVRQGAVTTGSSGWCGGSLPRRLDVLGAADHVHACRPARGGRWACWPSRHHRRPGGTHRVAAQTGWSPASWGLATSVRRRPALARRSAGCGLLWTAVGPSGSLGRHLPVLATLVALLLSLLGFVGYAGTWVWFGLTAMLVLRVVVFAAPAGRPRSRRLTPPVPSAYPRMP